MQRDTKAVLICAALAVLVAGYLAMRHGEHVVLAVLILSMAWHRVAQWLARFEHPPIEAIHAQARRGALRLSGLARLIDSGSLMLLGVAGVCWLVTSWSRVDA